MMSHDDFRKKENGARKEVRMRRFLYKMKIHEKLTNYLLEHVGDNCKL